jgi:hypothetical protein
LARDPNYIPLPPAEPPDKLPKLTDDELSEEGGWRIHRERDVRKPKRYPTGKWRFDAPKNEYAVSYLNEDCFACFGEVYGDRQEIPPDQAERFLSRITYTRPLRVVALDDGEVLAHFRLDLNISASVDYTRTMQWGFALHEWYPEADGLRYLGRHAATYLNRCLFLDRCADAIEAERRGKLGDLRDMVMRAADARNLAPRLFDPRRPAGWP